MQTHGRENWRALLTKILRAFITLVTAVTLVACSGGVVLEPTEGPVIEARKVAQAATLTNRITAIESGRPAQIALHSSQVFFESAQVVVLASSSEDDAVSRAASVAIAMGTPLLLTAPAGENIAGSALEDQDGAGAKTGSLNTELLRLGTRAVLTVGEVSLHQLDATSLVVLPVPDDENDLEEIVGTDVRPVETPARADAVEALVNLELGEIYPAPEVGEAPTAYGSLPKTLPAERNERTTAFAGTSTRYYAGVANARAAGARIFVGEDPASVTEAVDHLALHPSRPVVGLGEEFSDPQQLQRMVAPMQAGQILPSGAQRVFRANGERINLVTVDSTEALRQSEIDNAEDVLNLAESRAEGAAKETGQKTVPGVEVTAANNTYDEMEYWADQAKSVEQYLVLSVRPTGDLIEAITPYEDLLTRADVGLRLDVSDRDTVEAGEVNEAVVYLRRLVRDERLPQKLAIVDLGKSTAIANPESLLTTSGEVSLTLSVDDGQDALWRENRELFGQSVDWGVVVTKVGDDGDAPRKYPEVEAVLGKDEASLMTYR